MSQVTWIWSLLHGLVNMAYAHGHGQAYAHAHDANGHGPACSDAFQMMVLRRAFNMMMTVKVATVG